MRSLSPQHQEGQEVMVAEAVPEDTEQRCEPLDEQRRAAVCPVLSLPDKSRLRSLLSGEPLSDPVSRLPFELATACFRRLDFRGRFAVSHVSRAWRRVALADCCLWNTLDTGTTRWHGSEVLEALLARSGDVPFNFAWASSAPMPAGLPEVLVQNMGRMGKLKCWGTSGRLFQPSAPWLRRLTLRGRAVLPADWPQRVPRLEVLELDLFSIPDDLQPFPALTSFFGFLTEASRVPVLARVFPRLVRLQLGGVTQDAAPALGAPPLSCRSVVLKCAPGAAAVDYAPFLRACRDRRIPHIVLSGAASLSAAAQEFADATRGEFTLVVRGGSSLTLECATDGVVRIVDGPPGLPFVDELGGFAFLDRLAELSLELEVLLAICDRQQPAAAFPALRVLRLELAPEDIARTAHIPGAPLAMPRLAEVVLEAHRLDYARDRAHFAWLLADWPAQLPALVTFAEGRPRLDTLTVVMASSLDAEHFAARQALGRLRALAETLHVTHRESESDSDGYAADYYYSDEEDDFDEY